MIALILITYLLLILKVDEDYSMGLSLIAGFIILC